MGQGGVPVGGLSLRNEDHDLQPLRGVDGGRAEVGHGGVRPAGRMKGTR